MSKKYVLNATRLAVASALCLSISSLRVAAEEHDVSFEVFNNSGRPFKLIRILRKGEDLKTSPNFGVWVFKERQGKYVDNQMNKEQGNFSYRIPDTSMCIYEFGVQFADDKSFGPFTDINLCETVLINVQENGLVFGNGVVGESVGLIFENRSNESVKSIQVLRKGENPKALNSNDSWLYNTFFFKTNATGNEYKGNALNPKEKNNVIFQMIDPSKCIYQLKAFYKSGKTTPWMDTDFCKERSMFFYFRKGGELDGPSVLGKSETQP
ncbi:hypothetical protein [Anthocerotibacter panamensis]|uniref:hypothetical protein n=1 Tax=Anthocerotibacter panamensis TaxID=2857077 RepID=UPI001C40379C|nr:hypothetical protein [Anthocerotibacter panamensis]